VHLDVRAILVAGVGFFLDSYDIFSINLITSLIGLVFWGGDDADGDGEKDGLLPEPVNQALKASTSSGIIIGMILFGYLAEYDRIFVLLVLFANLSSALLVVGGCMASNFVSSSGALSAAPLSPGVRG
jgi:MFS transporter, PHS family, inorganic phosphate transporter